MSDKAEEKSLQADLEKLNAMSDEEFLAKCREAWIKKMAREFQVPLFVAEARLSGFGPYLPK